MPAQCGSAADRSEGTRPRVVGYQPQPRPVLRTIDGKIGRAEAGGVGVAYDLGLGIVPGFDCEHSHSYWRGPTPGIADAVVQRDRRQFGWSPVEEPQRSMARSGATGIGRPHRRGNTRLEGRVEIFIEQIDRLRTGQSQLTNRYPYFSDRASIVPWHPHPRFVATADWDPIR
jgi:hypothetical protein